MIPRYEMLISDEEGRTYFYVTFPLNNGLFNRSNCFLWFIFSVSRIEKEGCEFASKMCVCVCVYVSKTKERRQRKGKK